MLLSRSPQCARSARWIGAARCGCIPMNGMIGLSGRGVSSCATAAPDARCFGAGGAHYARICTAQSILGRRPGQQSWRSLATNRDVGHGAVTSATSATHEASHLSFTDPKLSYEHQRTSELLRAWLVLGLCSFPPFIQHSGRLLAASGGPAHNAGLLFQWLQQWLHGALYRHFCAGSTQRDVWMAMNRLRAHNVGAILDLAEEQEEGLGTLAGEGQDQEAEKEASHVASAGLPALLGAATASASSFRRFHSIPANHSVSAAAAAHLTDVSLRTMPLLGYQSEELCERRLAALLTAVDTTAASMAGAAPGFCVLQLPALGDRRLLERLSAAVGAVRGLFLEADGDADGFLAQADFDECFERLAAAHGAPSVALELSRLFIVDGRGLVDWVGWMQRLEPDCVMAIAGGLRRGHGPSAAGEAAALGLHEDGQWRGPLSTPEQRQLKGLLSRLDRLVHRAVAKGVKLMIDADHGPLRPAVEHIAQNLMRRHNRAAAAAAATGPRSGGASSSSLSSCAGGLGVGGAGAGAGAGGAAVFATYQSYLRDTPRRLADDLARAERQGYVLGAKLVCGAYLPQEHTWAADASRAPAVWGSAQQTHASYDACLGLLLSGVERGCAEMMVASNSQARVEAAVAGMAARGLDPRVAPVYFAQLLGMADNLSLTLGSGGYKVFKLCPYGDEAKVAPYLLRRVHETQRALQAGRQDLQLVRAELWRRFAQAWRAAVSASDERHSPAAKAKAASSPAAAA